jgi:hypothetical protein
MPSQMNTDPERPASEDPSAKVAKDRKMPFTVIVADNFHYMDKSENYKLGDFDSLEQAVEAAKRIVDECLASGYQSGESASSLYQRYTSFGPDPYIISPGTSGVLFSEWNYARQRCESICGPKEAC